MFKPKWPQDDPKMIPKWSQNGSKMVPRRPQEGPKNNKKTKTKYFGPQEAPPPKYSHLLGPKLDPNLELSWAILMKKVFQNTLGKPFAFKHHFLTKICFPGHPWTPKNLNFAL